MTTYPEAFDSDLELPRASDNVTELSSDLINSLRDAIIAIQQSIGLMPQGNKSSFTNRVNVSIDANGFIKRNALENIGLVTLPIANKHIGATAAIQESKLALDYNTAALKNMVDSLRTDVGGVISGLAINTDASNSHALGLAHFHDGYHIKINKGTQVGVAGLQAKTVGDALNELGALLLSGNNTLEPHIDLGMPSDMRHIADVISVNATTFQTIDRSARTVQDALDSIDSSAGILGTGHADTFHANGILKSIRSGDYYNPSKLLLGPIEGAHYSEGTGVINFPGVINSLSAILKPGDIVVVHAKSGVADVGSYQIRAVGPIVDADTLGGLTELGENEVDVFHTFTESRAPEDKLLVSVYGAASISSEAAPLACAVRNNETITDTVSILRPDAARAVSIGLNGAIINSDGYELHIKAGIGGGVIRELTIPELNLERLGTNQAEPVDAKSIANRINAYVSDPDLGFHFPITAYRVGNELAISHNMVGSDYTIEIGDGYTGNFALGFDAYGANITDTTILGNANNSFTINGTTISSVRTLFDGYVNMTAPADTFVLWSNSGQMINPLRYGIKAGSVMHVTGHQTHGSNGSYTLMAANAAGVSVFNAETINAPLAPTIFNVHFTDADVSLASLANAETDRGIIEIYIDSSGRTMAHQRLKYGTNLGSGIEIIGVSSGFPSKDVVLSVGLDADNISFNIIDDTIYGDQVVIHDTFDGKFKLYHPNGLDYLTIQIVPGVIPGGLEVVSVNYRLNYDEAFLLGTVHYDGALSVTNLIDSRLFGHLSPNEARDDLIELFSQRPTAELRSDGVARGFDILDAFFYEPISKTQAVPLRGGVAYVNGARVAVETQKVVIPSYDAEGNLISSARRLIAVNDLGSIQLVSDELGELLVDGYSSSAAFGRLLPLYYVDILDGGIEDVIDVRRFINGLDAKLDLIVDETGNVVGNFRTLEGALLYADRFPGREKLTIKIVNSVSVSSALVIPEGVSLLGDVAFGGNGKHRILNDGVESHYLLTLSGDNRIENLEIHSPEVSLGSSLVYIDGSNVNIEKCKFSYGEAVTSNSGIIAVEVSRNATKDISIVNNRINNVYSGIVAEFGTDNLRIEYNILSGVSGTGSVAHGIKVGSAARAIDELNISYNSIRVPSVVLPTDLRGISVDTGFDIERLNIFGNSIIHSSQNTMTNGIRIDILDGYEGIINHLSVDSNVVDGIKLDDNFIYGLYVANANEAIISNNYLSNVGVQDDNRTDTACIKIASTIGHTKIHNNTLKDCDVLRGIEIDSQPQTTRVEIIGNTLVDIGVDAHYIRGAVPNSTVSDNVLVGPGKIGIRWSGANSTIANNHLSRPNTAAIDDTDYAFEEYALFIPASDLDIMNNTITGMIFDQESIGISNGGSSRDRIKIIGNTISGSLMFKMVELFGSYHAINNNKFNNEALPTGQATLCLQLNSVHNSMIMGNLFSGAISVAIASSASSVSNLNIANNSVVAERINSASIILDGTTESCFVSGNRFPEGLGADNSIGITPSFGVYNSNLMGINLGLKDTRGLHAASGVTGMEVNDGYGFIPHWAMKDTNAYWEINRVATPDQRRLYFPISVLPNGAALDSIQVQGKILSPDGTLTTQLFKRSTQAAGLPSTSISNLVDMSLPSGNFGNNLSFGLVDVSTTGGEIINYSESNYYLEIVHQGADVTDAADIRIYGVTLNFTY